MYEKYTHSYIRLKSKMNTHKLCCTLCYITPRFRDIIASKPYVSVKPWHIYRRLASKPYVSVKPWHIYRRLASKPYVSVKPWHIYRRLASKPYVSVKPWHIYRRFCL